MKHLTTLFQYRDLLWLWTTREVRVRYKQSLLGVAWAILQPLALTIVFTVVFSYLVQVDTGDIPYPIFAFTALMPWTLFSTALSFGIPSLINNLNLVTKIYFPREVLPLASVGAALVDFFLSVVIFIGLLALYHVRPTIEVLWVVPLLIIQIALTLGVTFLGSAVIVFFRDVRFVIPLLLQLWMYATPIIYPVDLVPLRFKTLYFLNPMAGIIDGYRRAVVLGEPPQQGPILLATLISAVVLVVGYWLFKRLEPLFADLI